MDMDLLFPLFFFTCIVRALEMQARKMSRMQGARASKLLPSSDLDWMLAAVRMVKSLGGKLCTDKRLANLMGGTRGSTRRSTEMTARWTRAVAVCSSDSRSRSSACCCAR